MLSALSLADRGLAERLIAQTFHYVPPPPNNSGSDTPASSGADGALPLNKKAAPRNGSAEDKAQIIGSHIRDKVLGAIEACRDMLSRELPERRVHWTNVLSSTPTPTPFPVFKTILTYAATKKKAVIKAQITPLKKKLKNCRDPERWNLVELQRARREQAAKRADSEEADPGGDRMVVDSDGAVFGDPLPTKRRKVLAGEGKAKGLADPFGGTL